MHAPYFYPLAKPNNNKKNVERMTNCTPFPCWKTASDCL